MPEAIDRLPEASSTGPLAVAAASAARHAIKSFGEWKTPPKLLSNGHGFSLIR